MFLEMAGASIPAKFKTATWSPLKTALLEIGEELLCKYYGERRGGSVSEGYYNHGVPPHEGVAVKGIS